MKRPTFFISSTIFDFQDLRSALKFYLEEQGCKVLASEFNDFTKPLDKHSYQACLDAIHTADYFILLIGSRIGGWYDEMSRISITQHEYREAYTLHKAGKLKLLNFVRADVWRVKEDRRELAKYLESISLDEASKKSIANFPSKSAEDAEFLSAFITEVGRNQETKLAVKDQSPAPTGNWVHVFSGFRDIIDVMNGAVLSSTPIEDLMLKRLLRRELREFMAQSLVKIKTGSVYSPRNQIDLFHAEYPITLDARNNKFTTVSTKRWDGLSFLSFQLLGLQLHPVVLSSAISQPTFLDFDLSTDSYKETPIYEALLLLQSEIRKLNRANTSETLSIIYEHSPRGQQHRGETLQIETMKLATFLHLMDRWANVIELSRSLLRHMDGEPFQIPNLRPDSPIQGMQEMLEQEKLSASDLDKFIAQN